MQRLEIIGAMHKCSSKPCHRTLNILAQLKEKRFPVVFWLTGQFQNLPAACREIIFDAAADVAIAASDRADFFIAHKIYSVAVSQPMRCALAMTEKVIVVAGMLGSTLASTAWRRDQPRGRPSVSLSNFPDAIRIGSEPPQ